jgi:O-antigen/teichoic acid export membrane protein
MVYRRLGTDSLIYGGADLFTKILSFFSFPILAAALSPRAFGALELMMTVTGLLGLIMNCGLNNAVQRFYWEKHTDPSLQSKIVSSGFVAQIAFGVVAVLLGCLAIPFVLPYIRAAEWPLTWLALLSALVVMAFSQWSQYSLDVIRLHFAPWHYFALCLLSRVSTIFLGLVAVIVLGLGIDGLLMAQALVLIMVTPLAMWLIRKDFSLARFDYSQARELVEFGYPFIFAGIAYWLFGAMDRWMLASMASVDEVGIYSVASRFASVLLFVSAAFGKAWSPTAIKIRSDYPEQYRAIYGQVLLLLLFCLLAVGGGIALFSGELIGYLLPKEYYSSVLPLSILCFGIILQGTQQVTAIGISLEKKTYLFARLAWITAAVNFTANYILIPKYGAIGAASGTLISYIILTGSYFYYTQRLHPIVIQWLRLSCLLLLGSLIAFVSVTLGSLPVDILLFFGKSIFLLVSLFIGWKLIPMHSIGTVNQ